MSQEDGKAGFSFAKKARPQPAAAMKNGGARAIIGAVRVAILLTVPERARISRALAPEMKQRRDYG